jgi:hypothetical protein
MTSRTIFSAVISGRGASWLAVWGAGPDGPPVDDCGAGEHAATAQNNAIATGLIRNMG